MSVRGELTEAQGEVVNSPARLAVVMAAPGSGKTRVFVEVLRRHLKDWPAVRQGVAALSFTNAAEDEIARRIGGPPPPPHFVGTLDAFFLRFVVRPFAHIVGASTRGVRLVPAPVDLELDQPEVKVGLSEKERASLFAVSFFDGEESAPTFRFHQSKWSASQKVPPQLCRYLLGEKRKEWSRSGRITHADCHYLSALLLRHPEYGPALRRIVAKRFPVILVDEFQDTGWFLGRALLALLGERSIRSVVVGDPDQAIYEFNGADPELFQKAQQLPDARLYSLPRTHRCSAKVAAVASALSISHGSILAEGNSEGRAMLLVHDHETATGALAESLLAQFNAFVPDGGTHALLGRRGETVRALAFAADADDYSGVARASRRLDLAVRMLRENRPDLAMRYVQCVLADIVFGKPTPTLEDLREQGISQREWKLKVGKILWAAHSPGSAGETWDAWTTRMREVIRNAALELGWREDARSLGGRFRRAQGGDRLRPLRVRQETTPLDAALVAATVHKVKGGEFDNVTLFVPKPGRQRKNCPSVDWWPEVGMSAEERRIAFVAASRAREAFLLCIHRQSYEALRQMRPEFVRLFEVIDPHTQEEGG